MEIQEFLRFNRKSVDDRLVDTLVGLAMGITADGVVTLEEAEGLRAWLIRNRGHTSNPIIENLYEKVETIFADGVMDTEEAKELFSVLSGYSGGEHAPGEVSKPYLPLDDPAPKLIVEENSFVLTGTFAYGTRRECEREITVREGTVKEAISMKTDYLVIGSYVTSSWIHETYGRKIERAMELRNEGRGVKIVSEIHWAESLKLI